MENIEKMLQKILQNQEEIKREISEIKLSLKTEQEIADIAKGFFDIIAKEKDAQFEEKWNRLQSIRLEQENQGKYRIYLKPLLMASFVLQWHGLCT